MAGNDDPIARLHAKKYTREAWDEPHGTYDQPCDADDYGAEESFVNPAGPDAAREIERLRTALAERDATIERLATDANEWRDATMEARRGCVQRSEVINSLRDHLETAERERDEARAEVERKDASLREARDDMAAWGAYASEYFQEKHDLEGDLAKIDAALTPAAGAKDV